MEKFVVKTIEDLIPRLDLFDNLTMFRGHSDIKWILLPTIGRMHENLVGYEHWQVYEDHILEKFQKLALPFITSAPTNKYEWLILGQHHGLPTRLLDWTTNPLKGLFFAVENPSIKTDGVLWQLEVSAWWTKITWNFNTFDNEFKIAAFFPDHSNERLVAQESCFTIYPMPENTSRLRPLDKMTGQHGIKKLSMYIIPKKCKRHFRIELEKLGISHETMFPSLDGVATSIRRHFDLKW